MDAFIFLGGGVVVVFMLLLFIYVSRYKRCPSDKIMVVSGKVRGGLDGSTRAAKCMHGGATFVWPIFQEYAFLDLTPIPIEVSLTGALSKQNIRVDVPSRFTVGISTEPNVMTNAAERLLGLHQSQVEELATDIILGQLRLVIATMDIEEINSDRDKFLENVTHNVETEIKKIGLRLINVNVTDIKDESGYIQSLGKEAAAKAVNDARKTVAERNRDGAIGEKKAKQEERTKVAELEAQAEIGEADANQQKRSMVSKAEAEAQSNEAEAEKTQRIRIANAKSEAQIGEANADQLRRIKMAEANALAISGENESKIKIADSEAERRQRAAEAEKRAVSTERISQAEAEKAAYTAQEEAELARAALELASQKADVIVKAQIEKEKKEIEAEAEAEMQRRRAKGEADAIFLKMDAEARGLLEVMSKQSEGFSKFVEAAGGDPRQAVLLMIAEKLPEIIRTQVEAIKNLKIDKITVWDGGGQNGNNGPATANFLSGMYKSIPPLEDLFQMAGMELPTYLKGNKNGNEEPAQEVESEKTDNKLEVVDKPPRKDKS